MTSAEYLTARGWIRSGADWLRPDGSDPDCEFAEAHGEPEALALQLAEDRAVFAFVAAHSEVTIVTRSPLFPDDVPHTEDVRVVGVRCEEKKP